MIELPRNNYTSKTFDNENGTRTLEAYAGYMHYKDMFGDYQDISLVWQDMGTYWQCKNNSYKVYVNKTFGQDQLIRYDNKYETVDHTIYFTPHSVWWIDADDPTRQTRTKAKDAQGVTGTVSGETITFEDAFGSGIHFLVTLKRNGITKYIKIDSQPNLGTPPYADWFISPIFKWEADGLTVKAADLADWNELDYYESSESIEVREPGGLKSYIRKAHARDSKTPIPRFKRIKLLFEKKGGSLWMGKLITKQMLENAVYPVYSDALVEYNPSTQDGFLGVEKSTWAAAYGATTADYTVDDDSEGDGIVLGVWAEAGPVYGILRVAFDFNTAAMPDNAVISACELQLYATEKNDDDSGAVMPTKFTGFTGGSDELVDADFNNFGNALHSADTDLSGMGTAQYNTIAMSDVDADDFGYIDKTGETYIGIRERHDIDNESPVLGTEELMLLAFHRAEEANPPKLTVTYTIAYSLSVDAGSYAVTGTAADVLKGPLIGADAGSYAVTGTPAPLLLGRLLSVGSGFGNTYTITGQDNSLLLGRSISVDAGSFTITGQSAELLKGYLLSLGIGAYAITGSDVTLTYSGSDVTIDADSGSFTITGQLADLLYNKYLLAGIGSVILTGQDVDLLYGRFISAGSGTYTITGQDVDLLCSRLISAGSGTYTITGQILDLLYGRFISAINGTYAITGQDVGLDYLGDKTINVEAGGFTITGQLSDLLYNRKISVEVGSVLLSGQDVDLLYGRLLSAGDGVYAITGQDIGMLRNYILPLSSGAYILTGADVDYNINKSMVADSGVFAITGQTVDFLQNFVLISASGSIILTGLDVTLTYSGTVIAEGLVKMTFTSKAPKMTFTSKAPKMTFTNS